jgi:hypothetical protein
MSIKKQENTVLFDSVRQLLTEARGFIVRNVNHTMVCTYFEIGRMIVEDEQKGEHRAEYGKQVLKELSEKLIKEFGRGFSLTNLEQMRFFYKAYAQIPQTVSEELQIADNQDIEKSSTALTKSLPITQTLSAQSYLPKFTLSWSHYLKLMRIDDPAERRFYEIEAANNNWSLRELRRQCDTALYQRLALSRDKEGIKKLSVLPNREELKKLIENKE